MKTSRFTPCAPWPALLALAAALAFAATAQAQGQGHFASVVAAAKMYTIPDFIELQPWQGQIEDRGGISASAVNHGGAEQFFFGKSVSSSGYADLSTGRIGLRTEVTSYLATPTLGASAAVIATMADSFRIAGPSGPFVWAAGEQARFDVHLDGMSNNTSGKTFIDWQFGISIYKPGTLDTSTGISDPDNLLGGMAWSSNKRGDGSNPLYIYPAQGAVVQVAETHNGGLDQGGWDLSAAFNPQGDFDWAVQFLSFTSLSDQTGTQLADFSQTATLSFAGPLGTVTHSGSGVFPSTSPIPEVQTWALILLGLGGLALRGRTARS